MQNQLDILETALKGCERLLTSHPSHQTLLSIRQQLVYLVDLVSGTHQDRSRLKDIIIGAQTARDIEDLDEAVAESFYKAASIAREMREDQSR